METNEEREERMKMENEKWREKLKKKEEKRKAILAQARKNWAEVEPKLKMIFQKAVKLCIDEGTMNEEMGHRYMQSGMTRIYHHFSYKFGNTIPIRQHAWNNIEFNWFSKTKYSEIS